jgi:hypothetical protein
MRLQLANEVRITRHVVSAIQLVSFRVRGIGLVGEHLGEFGQ